MKQSYFNAFIDRHRALIGAHLGHVPLGARAGSLGAISQAPATLNLVAKIGSLPADWWSHAAPPPPPWPTPVTDPWVQVTVLPQVGGPVGHQFPESLQGQPVGWGVIFDPKHPEAHGIPTYVEAVSQPIAGNATYVAATVRIPANAWPGWPRAQTPVQASTFWLAATKADAKPSDTTGQWVKITHDPGAGPTINGQATQQGRGILFEQIGTGPRRRLGTAIVYQVKPAQAGWVAEVSYYESSSLPLPPGRTPKCTPSQGLYRSDEGKLVCGIPVQMKGTDQCHGLDGFTLPSQGGGGGGGPSGGGGSGVECGALVEEPTGAWAAATFFAQPPHRQRLWVQIKSSPGDHGWRFGEGILHFGDKQKNVLIIEIGGTQQRLRVRFVPNDAPFMQPKPSKPSGSNTPGFSPPGTGFSPFGAP